MNSETKSRLVKERLERFRALGKTILNTNEGAEYFKMLVEDFILNSPVANTKYEHNSEQWAFFREGQNNVIRYQLESAGMDASVIFKHSEI